MFRMVALRFCQWSTCAGYVACKGYLCKHSNEKNLRYAKNLSYALLQLQTNSKCMLNYTTRSVTKSQGSRVESTCRESRVISQGWRVKSQRSENIENGNYNLIINDVMNVVTWLLYDVLYRMLSSYSTEKNFLSPWSESLKSRLGDWTSWVPDIETCKLALHMSTINTGQYKM